MRGHEAAFRVDVLKVGCLIETHLHWRWRAELQVTDGRADDLGMRPDDEKSLLEELEFSTDAPVHCRETVCGQIHTLVGAELEHLLIGGRAGKDRAAVDLEREVDLENVSDGRQEVDELDVAVARLSLALPRRSHEERHGDYVSPGSVHWRAPRELGLKRQTVIRGDDDQRAVEQPRLFQPVEEAPEQVVDEAEL